MKIKPQRIGLPPIRRRAKCGIIVSIGWEESNHEHKNIARIDYFPNQFGRFLIGDKMKEIPLTQGKVAIVDDEDFEWLDQWKWCMSYEGGYAVRGNEGEGNNKIYMHTLILQTPTGLVCDHINRNRLDNRRCNLRICSRSDNQQNRTAQSNNTSGYKGVTYFSNKQKRNKRWVAQIGIHNKHYQIGYFYTAEEAAIAYDKVAIEMLGETAVINFPREERI